MSGTRKIQVQILNVDRSLAAALVRQGLLPCTGLKPHVAFTIHCVEVYRGLKLCCPHLAVEIFVRWLADLQVTSNKSYLCQQLSIAYDLYICLLDVVNFRVMTRLGRANDDWQIKHCCPLCTYKLTDEVELEIAMLLTYDGNDSAKRMRRTKERYEGSATNAERWDKCDGGGSYWLSIDKVD